MSSFIPTLTPCKSAPVLRASPSIRKSIRCQSNDAVEPTPSTTTPSRREALLSAMAVTLAVQQPLAARAEGSTKRVYLDWAVNAKPIGRCVIEVYDDVPIGALRFLELVEGKDGVSFRRRKIEFIAPDNGYIRTFNAKELSRKGSGRVRLAGGDSGELLEAELAQSRHRHDREGVVSLSVLNDKERVTKEKLVAIKGQFVTVETVFGEAPNGSGLAITTMPEPDLDATNLVVGHVVEGLDVIKTIAALPRVKDNSESPFFKAGKAAGDKRADVAEKAFGKPFQKITIAECGLL